MWYQLRKWYFDFNRDEELFGYIFIAEVRFLFFNKYYLTAHIYDKYSGIASVSRFLQVKKCSFNGGTFHIDGRKFQLEYRNDRLSLITFYPDLKVNLVFQGIRIHNPEKSLTISQKRKTIRWFPFEGSIQATGSFEINSKIYLPENQMAYGDFLFSEILPYKVPVKRLYWGRIVKEEVRIIYSIAITEDKRQFALCLIETGTQRFSFQEISLKKTGISPDQEEDCCLHLEGFSGRNKIDILTQRGTKVSEGSFIESEKFPERFFFTMVNKLSKNPRGCKFISSAEAVLETEIKKYNWQNLICIDEYVLF